MPALTSVAKSSRTQGRDANQGQYSNLRPLWLDIPAPLFAFSWAVFRASCLCHCVCFPSCLAVPFFNPYASFFVPCCQVPAGFSASQIIIHSFHSHSRATLEKPMQPKYVEDRCWVPFNTVFYLMIHIKHVDITTTTKSLADFHRTFHFLNIPPPPPFWLEKI